MCRLQFGERRWSCPGPPLEISHLSSQLHLCLLYSLSSRSKLHPILAFLFPAYFSVLPILCSLCSFCSYIPKSPITFLLPALVFLCLADYKLLSHPLFPCLFCVYSHPIILILSIPPCCDSPLAPCSVSPLHSQAGSQSLRVAGRTAPSSDRPTAQ